MCYGAKYLETATVSSLLEESSSGSLSSAESLCFFYVVEWHTTFLQ